MDVLYVNMNLRNPFYRALAIIIAVGSLHGAEILDKPVPWSGRISGYTLDELVARMRGWSDVGDSGTFQLSSRIPEELATKKINLLLIPDEPRPTYREILVSALEKVGQKVEVRRSKEGIEIVYIYSRSFRISNSNRQSLARKGRLSLEGIQRELADKGWVFSESVEMKFLPESSLLIVQGTSEDIDKAARFFSEK